MRSACIRLPNRYTLSKQQPTSHVKALLLRLYLGTDRCRDLRPRCRSLVAQDNPFGGYAGRCAAGIVRLDSPGRLGLRDGVRPADQKAAVRQVAPTPRTNTRRDRAWGG